MQSALKQYYNINRIFMSFIGGWPTQSTLMKIFLPTLVVSVLFSFSILELLKISVTGNSITELCEYLILLLITTGSYIKLSGLVLNSKNVKRILSLIDYHWQIFTHSLEKEIMHDYAIEGKQITISYAAIIYFLLVIYLLIPVIPKLLDLIKPLNESRPSQFLFDIDYSFDKEEYYYPVLLHMCLGPITCAICIASVDTAYVMFAQHGCSLFAAIGERLENLEVNSKRDNWFIEDVKVTRKEHGSADYISFNEDDEIYREIILLLRKHQLVIEYVSVLNSAFALYSFLLLSINIMAISLLGIQILLLMDHKEDMIRYVALAVGAFLHLFALSYPGQKIIDHSTSIFDKTYSIQWYKMSRRTTQLLSILLYRCHVPCTSTAGKIYVLSMANYGSMVKTSLSYFTTFSSIS